MMTATLSPRSAPDGTTPRPRRGLVIGTQCDNQLPLACLPGHAEALYAALIDPVTGGCVSALGEGMSGLLLDPTVQQFKDRLDDAFRNAAAAEATLILAYLGHAIDAVGDFYLLPKNATPDRVRDDTAVHLVQTLRALYADHRVDGLVLLLDTCYAGKAAVQAASRLIHEPAQRIRFDLFTATGDKPAYDGCFTREIAALVKEGIDGEGSFLRSAAFYPHLKERCKCQTPDGVGSPAPELWIARNRRTSPPAFGRGSSRKSSTRSKA